MTDSSFPAWLAAQAGREARGLTRRLVEVDCGKRPLDRSTARPLIAGTPRRKKNPQNYLTEPSVGSRSFRCLETSHWCA